MFLILVKNDGLVRMVRLGRRLAVMRPGRRLAMVGFMCRLAMVRLGCRVVVMRRRGCMVVVVMMVVIIPVIGNQGIEHELTGGKEQRGRRGKCYC